MAISNLNILSLEVKGSPVVVCGCWCWVLGFTGHGLVITSREHFDAGDTIEIALMVFTCILRWQTPHICISSASVFAISMVIMAPSLMNQNQDTTWNTSRISLGRLMVHQTLSMLFCAGFLARFYVLCVCSQGSEPHRKRNMWIYIHC